MTHEEIMAMAREAGFRTGHINMSAGDPLPFIAPISATSCIVEVQRLIELAVAKERDACAQVCDGVENGEGETAGLACECAAAIRARGTKEGV